MNKKMAVLIAVVLCFALGIASAKAVGTSKWFNSVGSNTTAGCANPENALGGPDLEYATLDDASGICEYLFAQVFDGDGIWVWAKLPFTGQFMNIAALNIKFYDGTTLACNESAAFNVFTTDWQYESVSCAEEFDRVTLENTSNYSIDIQIFAGRNGQGSDPHFDWINASSYSCPQGSTCTNPNNAMGVYNNTWSSTPPISGQNSFVLNLAQAVYGAGRLYVRIDAVGGTTTHASLCFYGEYSNGNGHQACENFNNINLPPSDAAEWIMLQPPQNTSYTTMTLYNYDDSDTTIKIDAIYGYAFPGELPSPPY